MRIAIAPAQVSFLIVAPPIQLAKSSMPWMGLDEDCSVRAVYIHTLSSTKAKVEDISWRTYSLKPGLQIEESRRNAVPLPNQPG